MKVSMLTFEECRKLAADYLANQAIDLVLYEEAVHAGSYGWVFGYQSSVYLRTGRFSDALVGNGPILVDKHAASIHVLGTGMPIEFYVENYLACGDPFKVPSRGVELIGEGDKDCKVAAIRAVCKETGFSLGQAKRVVDWTLSGERITVDCITEDGAANLVEKLNQLGFPAEQLRA